MATMQSCEDSLNKLMAAVNQTLIESGRFFRSSGSAQSRAQLKRKLPAANDEFQAALDQLSEQIYLAKAVLERDYDSAGHDMASRENANLLSSFAHHSQPDDNFGTTAQAISDTSSTAGPAQPVAGESGVSLGDTDPPTGDIRNQAKGDSGQTALPASVTLSARTEEGPGVFTTSTHRDDASSKPNNENQTLEEDISMPPVDATQRPDAREEQSSQGQDDTHRTLGTFDSLLPGLESYANAGADESNVAIDNDAGNADRPRETTEHQSGRPDVVMADMPPPESNFDDLFVGVGDFADSEALLNNVDIGELDDSWFS